ncbi:hypothetical protein NB639_09175 [Oxalobacter formigenes]|uniref:hypothetical protein n=1 Tax=Oxalobacter formigenes TaxID=847 RepID=UPI0022AEE500|nr:hypothetical protein [Oxalobacter formigenes]WAW05473.1 hypothetical protein NB639_09175 [Oxalobacter formigenes]
MKNILPFPVIPNYALFHEELEHEASIWKAILYERQYGPVAIKVARCFRELDPVIFAPVIRAVATEDAGAAYMAMDDVVFEAVIRLARTRLQRKGGQDEKA